MMNNIPINVTDNSIVERTTPVLRLLNENLERYLLLSIYVYIISIIGVEVFRRFLLDNASLWGEETARFMFIYLTWIGASWGVHKRLHIRIDILHQYISERATGFLYILGDLVMLAFVVVAVQWTIPQLQTLLEFGAVTSALRVNKIFFQMAIPIGMGLMTVRILQALYRDVQDVRAGRAVYKGEQLFA
ncbi:TRAP transporter small permease [Halomicroarcula sp. GCM10025324]|uniref:TRAP transporter small permease n=1 Tax=Haloarcula TaxID=2237 RepID=UPI0023E7C0A9|nr:TRAP transporter small permease [Halomicroarcula sp. ZS-22-S1]